MIPWMYHVVLSFPVSNLVYKNSGLAFLISIWFYPLIWSFSKGHFRNNLIIINTLYHEIAHMIAVVLCLKPVKKIEANADGNGHIMYHGGISSFINLAPYLFPYVVYVLVFMGFVFRSNQLIILHILLGSLFGFFAMNVFKDSKPHQPDLKRTGLVIAYLLIIGYFIFHTLLLLKYVSLRPPSFIAIASDMVHYNLKFWKSYFL